MEKYSITPDQKIAFKPIFNDKDGKRIKRVNFPISWCMDRDDIGQLIIEEKHQFVASFIPYGRAGTVLVSVYQDVVKNDDVSITSDLHKGIYKPIGVAEITVTEDLGITVEMNGEIY